MHGNLNTRPLILFLGGLLYVVFTLVILRSVIRFDIFQLMLLLGVAFSFFFIALRKYWIGVLIGVLSIYAGGTAIPLLSRVLPYQFIAAVIVVYLLIDYAMKKRPPLLRWRGIYTLFLVSAIAVTARIIYDRPGAAMFGSHVGGVKKALDFIFSVYAFFIAYWAMTQAGSWRANLRLLLIISFVSYVAIQIPIRILSGSTEEAPSVYGLSFNWALYPIYAALLVVSLSPSARRYFSNAAFVIVSCFVLAMGAISMTRASMLQVPLMMLTAGFIYKRMSTAILTAILVAAVGIGGLLSIVPYHQLPDNVRRPLSIFVSQREAEKAYGIKDEFREELHEFAYQKIRENPWFGSGWNFDVAELISAMSMQQMAAGGILGGQLDITASFHNVFLIVATTCGVPTAVCFVLAISLAMISLLIYARKLKDPEEKAALAFLLVYCTCVYVMFFFNGGAWDAFAMCAALGVGFALRDKRELEHQFF